MIDRIVTKSYGALLKARPGPQTGRRTRGNRTFVKPRTSWSGSLAEIPIVPVDTITRDTLSRTDL